MENYDAVLDMATDVAIERVKLLLVAEGSLAAQKWLKQSLSKFQDTVPVKRKVRLAHTSRVLSSSSVQP